MALGAHARRSHAGPARTRTRTGTGTGKKLLGVGGGEQLNFGFSIDPLDESHPFSFLSGYGIHHWTKGIPQVPKMPLLFFGYKQV